MGKKLQNRRDFFRKLTARPDEEEGGIKVAPPGRDPLFERYSRKTLGDRVFSPEAADNSGNGTTANRVGNVISDLTPYSGTWSEWEVSHLLRRAGFGLKNTDVTNLMAMTTSAAVDAVVAVANTPAVPSATPLNNYNNSYADSSGVALGADWTSTNLSYVGATNTDSSTEYQRQLSLQDWHWGLWLNGDATIREKMVAFWYHFIPINFDDVRNTVNNSATLAHQYMKLLRDNATGNYQTLIKAIAKNPAMLVFLSGQYSTAAVPNENFGRELMELFMLGKLPTQNYAEQDVQAAAKVFSGWRVTSFTAAFPFVVSFNNAYHNTTNKTFSSFFAGTTIYGSTANTPAGIAVGQGEFDLLFNLLFAQQGTTIAKYVCRRLYRFFVYYDIDANVEANVIVPLAQALITNNWDMLPVLKLLFKSQHFYDMANRGVMIKSPFDFVAGTLRTFGVNTTAATGANQVVNQYTIWQYFNSYSNSNLEQGMGLVPNVSGWKAYYQEPGYYQNWVNTNTIQWRSKLLTALISGITTGGLSVKIDPIAFAQQYPNATIQDPDLLVDAIIKTLLTIDLDSATKAAMKTQNLLQNQTNNTYWTTAWNAYTASATTTNTSTVRTRLVNLITGIIQLAEYQLM